MKISLLASTCALTLGIASLAHAQPKFEFGKADDVKDVKDTEWTATAEAGLVFTTGNSRTTTVSGALKAARKQKQNKLSIEASGTFAKASTIGVAAFRDHDGDGMNDPMTEPLIQDDLIRTDKVSAQSYNAKLRYDRFLTEFNSLFVAALGGADEVAGKDFVGGGQAGYSRLLYKTEKHEIAGELGYDFSRESFVDTTNEPINIHSARGFLGYKGKLSETTSVDGSLEVLGNLNEQPGTSVMEDIRATGIGSLSTKLTKSVSFAFSLTAKFDNVPASVSFAGYTNSTTDAPEALKLDTTTKASLIINFL